MISGPAIETKSIVLTDEGVRRAQELYDAHFSSGDD